jgi:hypothetical protein
VGVVGVVCSSPGRRLTFSEKSGKILGNSRARRKILGVTGWEFREIPGILYHHTASFVGAPIMSRERCHVTQPRARINVSCSRAGLKGVGEPQEGCCEGQRRTAKDREGWVPDQGTTPWTGQGGTGTA